MTYIKSLKTSYQLRVWNRLEARPRKQEFDRVLRTEVRDPLWMLTRQWQLGEFKGEDTGSGIFAKVELQTSRLTRFKPPGASAQVSSYQSDLPLEIQVERLAPSLSYKERVAAGDYWTKLLSDHGLDGHIDEYKDPQGSPYAFTFPPKIEETDPDDVVLAKSRVFSQPAFHRYLSAISGRKIDGLAIYDEIKLNQVAAVSSMQPGPPNGLSDASQKYLDWFNSTYGLEGLDTSCWSDRKLEYQFDLALPNYDDPGGTPTNNTALRADEYYHGRLDWFSMNTLPDEDADPALTDNTNNDPNDLFTKTVTVIPTEARFAGMPNSRWWELEDGAVNFGKVDADTTDLANILITEFALVYQDDWFVIPYLVPVGSMSEVTGIVVKDVFGQRSLVEHSGKSGSSWNNWNMYNLSRRETDKGILPADTRLFIPPSLVETMESAPLESVSFIRDEAANMVWAIEKQVPDPLGSGAKGYEMADDLRKHLLEARPLPSATPSDASLSYELGDLMPENWIPFITRHTQGSINRSIVLQRAAMPRPGFTDYPSNAIRPRTSLLRPGLEDTDVALEAYFINEEEVPRAGIQVETTYQRTRWFNGKTYLWTGRRKRLGRGEGSSGLRFDKIIEKYGD